MQTLRFYLYNSRNFLSISFVVLFKKHLLLYIGFTFFLSSCDKNETIEEYQDINTGVITGYVQCLNEPVKEAIVRIQTTDNFVTTNDLGEFEFTELSISDPVNITAWASGYYIGGSQKISVGSKNIEINLIPLSQTDNPDYKWISAFAKDGKEANCQNCHSEPDNIFTTLPFDQWVKDAHANSAHNQRFLTMYLGTDIYGNQSPLTQYGYNRDYGKFPLPPNLNEAYFGPGYKLDFQSSSGNCAACHTPNAAIDNPYGIDPTQVTGVDAEGINCDFCHKVWDVRLNKTTGLPDENMPGVLSFIFRRPQEGHQFFAGPFDDVAPGEDTYTPVQKESRYCAACHFTSFWGVQIYNSFGEWLDSPYSNPQTGKTCQDCHMPSGLTDHFARYDKGGNKRDPKTIFSHRMLGTKDKELMQNAVTMTANAELSGNDISVEVNILNDKTGHDVPTDSPLRHLILLVEAKDESGNYLPQLSGPVLPDWCGVGNYEEGYYAGMPGTFYAKILEERWTGISPTGAYWKMISLVSDNRIRAMEGDRTTYLFTAPEQGSITVNVMLIFRREFINLRIMKGWDAQDIVMNQLHLNIER